MSDVSDELEITELLRAWGSGDHALSEEFAQLIYDELRRQAHRYLRQERDNHTLQTTALVNEAYLRLAELKRIDWQNRTHFFALAALMMRRILVNYAVSRSRLKRGGPEEQVPLEEGLAVAVEERDANLIELDEALKQLERLDKRQARIVELRYFSGLSIADTAAVLDISPATVKRDWRMAKAWLKTKLSGESGKA
jgi:RNA polymerase sigma factor (TIGR02999 family)